jgi:hypothetical protein
MIKVNAFALYRYKAAGNVKLTPPCIRISRQGEGSGVAETFGVLHWNRHVKKIKNLGYDNSPVLK